MFWWVLGALERPWLKLFLVGPEEETSEPQTAQKHSRFLKEGRHSRVFLGRPGPMLTCRDLLDGFRTAVFP